MDQISAGKLAQELEDASKLSLDWLKAVLSVPLDRENSPLLRAQSAAANIALNTQLRADALRLRAQREDKALERLMKLIREKEQSLPQNLIESRNYSNELLENALPSPQA